MRELSAYGVRRPHDPLELRNGGIGSTHARLTNGTHVVTFMTPVARRVRGDGSHLRSAKRQMIPRSLNPRRLVRNRNRCSSHHQVKRVPHCGSRRHDLLVVVGVPPPVLHHHRHLHALLNAGRRTLHHLTHSLSIHTRSHGIAKEETRTRTFHYAESGAPDLYAVVTPRSRSSAISAIERPKARRKHDTASSPES